MTRKAIVLLAALLWAAAAVAQPGWVDFTNQNTYPLSGGGAWELAVVNYGDYPGTNYLYAANVTLSLMRCQLPAAGSSDPPWTAFMPWVSGSCIDSWTANSECLIVYGTQKWNVNDEEGIAWSANNDFTVTYPDYFLNIPNYGGWPYGPPNYRYPARYLVGDVAIRRGNYAPVTDKNFWVLINTIPFDNENRGIYHFYEHGSPLSFTYDDEFVNKDFWKLFADRDPDNSTGNPDRVVAYALVDKDGLSISEYGLYCCIETAGTPPSYEWVSCPGSLGLRVTDLYQDEGDPDILFVSIKGTGDSGALYYMTNRGEDPFLTSWHSINTDDIPLNAANAYAPDMIADKDAEGNVKVYAAVGGAAMGCYHGTGSSALMTWESLNESTLGDLGNWNPSREMLIHAPGDFNRLLWGSWGGGVFEKNGLEAGWQSWDNKADQEERIGGETIPPVWD